MSMSKWEIQHGRGKKIKSKVKVCEFMLHKSDCSLTATTSVFRVSPDFRKQEKGRETKRFSFHKFSCPFHICSKARYIS
jgi:hypothetical protein